MLAAQLVSSHTAFLLFEDADNLLLAKPSFHSKILSFSQVKFSQLSV
jgi:hypothetical protein